MTSRPHCDVLIVGAGISGIGAGIELLRRGNSSFLLIEGATDLGGTWRDNTYPGVAVDIPSVSYCFSFEPNFAWSNAFAAGGEIQAYVRHCAEKYGVARHIRYGSRVLHARFDPGADTWTTELDDGTVLASRHLIAATGQFGPPQTADIRGLESFAGRAMHSARWDHGYDLSAKRVAVIGTGASAVQIVPEIAPRVARLSVFQRTPIWVAPRWDAPLAPGPPRSPRRSFTVRRTLRALSESQLELLTFLIVNYRAMWPIVRLVQRTVRGWMRRQLRDPEMAARLLPGYGLGCKRPATSNTYLAAFNRDNVALVTRPISHVHPRGIVTDDGVLHEVDTVILATGFLTTEKGKAPSFRVVGRDGVELSEWWDEHRRQAYAGVSVPGFPNFFLTAGPYSGGFNWFTMLEANLAHIMACIDEARARGATRVEVSADAHERYMRHIWRRADGTVFKSGICAAANSYYIDRHGDASLPLPHTPLWRLLRARRVGTHGYDFGVATVHERVPAGAAGGRMRRSMLEPFYDWVERNPDQLLYAFLDVDGRAAESYSYAQFLQRTTDIASHIRRTFPLQPGARVLLAYPPGLEMICAFVACVRLGLIPVPVYPPAGNGFQAALGKMDFIARDCRAAAVLTDRSYYWSMRLNETRHRVATLSLRRSPASRLAWIVTTDAERGCRETIADVHSPVLFLQYTSGSTSEPKGVVVTHDNLLDNCEAVVDHRPIGVSWLPQYHDMGLIGYYLFFSMKGERHTASLLDFIRRPALWLETISRYRGTASSAPNFAYEYCLRPDKVPAATAAQLDLRSLRFLMTAAEPVRADVYRAFIRKFEPCGLDAKSFFSAYGLAEFTLAVSNYGRTIREFDRAALRQDRVRVGCPDAAATDVTTLVSCGRPLGRTEVRIVHVTAEPRDAGENAVGEIWIRGPSKCRGYWGRPAASAEVFDARLPGDAPGERGWLRSGDMGFVHAGELYVCGRLKDMLIVRGLNFYPQDIEAIVESDHRVRKGCVAAFGCDRNGREDLIVVAELRDRRGVPDARELNLRLLRELGVTAASFAFIEARTIPKTSSGKIARHLVRERWREGRLRVVEQIDSGTEPEAPAAPQHRAWLRHFGLTGAETWTLEDAGFDSLKLVEFAHALKEQLETAGERDLSTVVDLRALHKIAICELVELLDQVSAAAPHARLVFKRALSDLREEHRALEADMMRRDSRLRFDAGSLTAARATTFPGDGAILLTGGTGFFGPFLLASLLQQTDHPLYVLVRASRDDAMRRIREGLRSIAVDGVTCPEGWERRVRPVSGDLSAPRFGVDDATWHELADAVGTVYHNGAIVNYLLDYASMREANVGGTNEVVRLAMTRRPKVLNHVSTTFVFGWSVQETLSESDTNAAMSRLDFGYSQSKWVAEQVVRDAMQRGLEARIFRPALLTPSVHGGGHNLDIAIRLLAFMIAHGLSTTAGNQVSFSPADLAADNIVAVSRIPESVGATYHVTRDEYATLSDVTAIIAELTGRPFRYFPLRSFVPEVIQRCGPGDILFPLLDFLVRSVDNISAMEFKRYDNSNYRRFRDGSVSGRADPPLHDVVHGILRFLRRRRIVDV